MLGCLMVPLASATFWLERTALDDESYADAVAPLPTEPEVSEALADFLVDEVLSETDARPGLEEFLRERLGNTAGSAAGAAIPTLEQQVSKIVDESLQSEAFAQFWRDANLKVHPVAVAAITGDDNPSLARQDGRVELDLKPAIAFVATDLSTQLGFDIPVPEDIGRMELFNEGDVERAQVAARLLRTSAWVFPLLGGMLLVLALILARRRRRSLFVIGAGVLIVSVATLFLLRELSERIAARASNTDLPEPAVAAIFDTLTRGLGDQTWILIGAGLGVAILAMVLGLLTPQSSGRR